jgi:hypothetical protein
MIGFDCATCGKHHAALPMSFGPEAPAPWFSIPEDKRPSRGMLNSDLCVIDDEHYFVRGRILLPVQNEEQPFCWLVWVSLSKSNFERTRHLWDIEGREREPAYFAWLCTFLPGYPESTLRLKSSLHTCPVGERPIVELEPTDHPLAVEQRDGISKERMQTLIESALHYVDGN